MKKETGEGAGRENDMKTKKWMEAVKRNVKDVTSEEVTVMEKAASVVEHAKVAAKQARRNGNDEEDDRQSETARKVFAAMRGWDSRRGESRQARQAMVEAVRTMVM